MTTPRKPKLIQHYDEPGVPHELTFTCYHSRPFLNKERTCQYLSDALVLARQKWDFYLWAYVFMPEHVHLLICPMGDDAAVSDILRTIKQSVARRAINYLRAEKPSALRLLATGQRHIPYRFWQDGPGYDRNATSDRTIQFMADYIHANPVRRGLAAYCDEWKWSSYLDWSGQGKGPVPLDLESLIMMM